MGAKCCIPIKQSVQMNLREKSRTSQELSARRSKRFLQWDNRTHTEDVTDKNSGGNGNVGIELKGGRSTELNSVLEENAVNGNYQAGPQGYSTRNNSSNKEKEICEYPNTASTSDPKPSPPASSDPSSSSSSSKTQLSKQVCKGGTPPLDLIGEKYDTPSVIPLLSNGFHIPEHYLDSWHMHPLAELTFSPHNHIMANALPCQSSFSSCVQTCGLCSGSSWAGFEVSISAVLVCGHVYHAECLEAVTPESSKFDPSCPICTDGESSATKDLAEGVRHYTVRIPRREVDEIDVNGNSTVEPQKDKGHILKNSRWLLLSRRLSRGSRSPRLSVESGTSRRKKKGLWGSYR